MVNIAKCTDSPKKNHSIRIKGGVANITVREIPALYALNSTHCAPCHDQCSTGCSGPVCSTRFSALQLAPLIALHCMLC